MDDATPTNKTAGEHIFSIVTALCSKFKALTPFELYERTYEEVVELYTDLIIHDYKQKHGNSNDVWVTSKTATWH